jgi:hypothetical protein
MRCDHSPSREQYIDRTAFSCRTDISDCHQQQARSHLSLVIMARDATPDRPIPLSLPMIDLLLLAVILVEPLDLGDE